MSSLPQRAFALLLVGLVVAGCGNGGEDETSHGEDPSVLPARALEFAAASDRGDLKAGATLCTTAAAELFEAEAEFIAMLLVQDDEPRPESKRTATTVRVDGETALVRVDREWGDEEADVGFLLLRLEEGTWRVDGFAREESDEPLRFADMVAGTRARIQRKKAERKPHVVYGPLVEAYLAAAAAKDGETMFAMMTPECAKREATGRNAFTAGFLAGRYKVAKWHFSRHPEGEDDHGSQTIKTILELEDGEMDNEPLRFQFVRDGDGWKIATIN